MTRKHVAARSTDQAWSRTDTAHERTPKAPSALDARRRLPLDQLASVMGSFGTASSPARFAGAVFDPIEATVGSKKVLFYRLHVDGMADAPPIAVSRLVPVLRILFRAYAKDAETGEVFATWAKRQGEPFFTELFDDYVRVTADDLPELLAAS